MQSKPSAPISATEKPSRRKPEGEFADRDWSTEKLLDTEGLVDQPNLAPGLVRWLTGIHRVTVTGDHHLPADRASVVAVNHCFTPVTVEGLPMSEHVLLLLRILAERLDHPARPMAHHGYFHPPQQHRKFQRTLNKAGFVPISVANGVRLLKAGRSILIAPEGSASLPPYQVQPLFWGFAKMAWFSGTPIIPTAFVGPHEALLRVVREDRHEYLNRGNRHPVPYIVEFLPAVDVRGHVDDPENPEQWKAFCGWFRAHLQSHLDRITAGRYLVKIARKLQENAASPSIRPVPRRGGW